MADGFDLAKYKSIGVNKGKGAAGGWGVRVQETVTEETGRVKRTRDEVGNFVTQHAKGDRQDVEIRAATVHAKWGG